MPSKCGWGPRHYLRVRGFKRGWVTDNPRHGHVVQQAVVKGEKVVMRDEDKSALVEAPLHRMIKLLTKDACGVKRVGTAMGLLWGAEVDVGRVVANSESEGQVFHRFRVLLLRKAIETNGAQIGGREGDFGRINKFYLGSYSS
jgi:hypothetical protein